MKNYTYTFLRNHKSKKKGESSFINVFVTFFPLFVHRCVGNNIILLTKAFRKNFIIPDFEEFTHQINRLFESAHQQGGGKVSKSCTVSAFCLVIAALYHVFPLCRQPITFLSWLSSARIFGEYLFAQLMDKGNTAPLRDVHCTLCIQP